MSAPPQLEIKFLDIFGDYYHMPSGSAASPADRKLGIPLYMEFQKQYGFTNPKFKTTPGTGLVGGVATEEEAEFVKYFGVPYIYGPSLVSQKEVCRPANYAKIKQFLEYRLVTLESQINNPMTVTTGSALGVQMYKKTRDRLKLYIADMNSTKKLATCDDYKIDYFQDDSDLMNYLTRALYYGLKPQEGTDEHVKCVNLFRDAQGANAELQALLKIVKDKRTDGMLSFMELIGSTLAGLIQKINQDRSFASVSGTSATAAGAAGAGASAASTDTLNKLRDELITFFDMISKADLGTKTFVKTAPVTDLLTQFTSAVAASKKYLITSSSKPGPAFPATVEDLKKKIMEELKKNPFDPVGTVYNTNMKKVLEDLLVFLEKGPVTSAAVGNMIDKLTLINAFKDVDISEIVKNYVNILAVISNDIDTSNKPDTNIIKSYQKLFGILNSLGLLNELKSSGKIGTVIQKNIKLSFNKQVEYKGEKYFINNYNIYKSNDIIYGYYMLAQITGTTKYVYFDEEIKDTGADYGNPITGDSVEEIIKNNIKYNIGDTIEVDKKPEIIREYYLNLGYLAAPAAASTTGSVTSTFNKSYVVTRLADDYFMRLLDEKTTYTTVTGKPENGEEKFDLSAAPAGGASSGGSSADVARLTAELAAAQAALTALKKQQAAAGTSSTSTDIELAQKTAELAKAQTDLATALADFKRVNDELTALKATPDAERIADLERQLADLKGILAAKTAAAQAAISTTTTDLDDLNKEKVRLEREITRLSGEISSAGTFTRTGPLKEELQTNSTLLIEELNKIIAGKEALIDSLTKLNTILTADKARLEAANADLAAQLAALQASADAAATKATADLATARTELAEAERLRQVAETNRTAEATRCATLQTELDALRASGTASIQRIAELEAELTAARDAAAAGGTGGATGAGGGAAAGPDQAAQITQLQERIQTLETELQEARAGRGTADTEKADAVRRAEAAEAARVAAQAAQAQAAADLEAARAALATAETEATRLRTAGTTSDEEIARLRQVEATATAAVDAAKAAATAEKEAAVAVVTAQFEAASAEAKAASTRAATAEEASAALKTQIASVTEELRAARQSATDLETQLSARSTLTAEEVTKLQDALTAAQTKASDFEAQVAALTSASGDKAATQKLIADLQAEVNKKEAEKGTLTTELQTATKALTAAQDAERKALRDKTTAEGRVGELESQLAAARAAATADSAALQARIKDLEGQLAAANKAAADAQAKIPPSQADIDRLTARKLELDRELHNINLGIAQGQETIRRLAAQDVDLSKRAGGFQKVISATERIQSLLEQVDALKTSLAEAKETAATSGAVSKLKTANADFYKAAQADTESRLSELQQQLQGVRDNLVASQEQISTWAQELRNKDRRIAELELQTKSVKGGTDAGAMLNLRLQLVKLKRKKEELEAQLKAGAGTSASAEPDEEPTLSEMLETIREFIKTMGGEAPDLTPEIKAKLARVEDLERQLEEKEDEIATLVENLQILKRTVSDLNYNKRQLVTQEGELRQIIQEYFTLLNEYKGELKDLKLQFGEHSHELNEYIDEIESELAEASIASESMEANALQQKALNFLEQAKKRRGKKGKIVKQIQSKQGRQTFSKGKRSDNYPVLDKGQDPELKQKNAEITKLTAQLAAVEEAHQNAIAAVEQEKEKLEKQNQALQVENTELQSQVADLEAQLEKMRSEVKVQTFGSLSGMLSSPAFKAATIGVFTNFAGKRDNYNASNAGLNANIQSTLPGVPEGAGAGKPLREYYYNTLLELAKELGAVNKDGSNDPNIKSFDNPEEIKLLANILKMMSSPQPSGIYSLRDNEFNIETVTDPLTGSKPYKPINNIYDSIKSIAINIYNNHEPSLYLPIIYPSSENSMFGTILDIQALTKFDNYFKEVNRSSFYIFYPEMKIGEIEKSIGKEEQREEYIKKIEAKLYNIQAYSVRQDAILEIKSGKQITLEDITDKKDKTIKFFNKPENGVLVGRAEIIRIFIKSLLSALKTAWGL